MCGFMGAVGQGRDVTSGLPWLSRRGPDSHHTWSSSDGDISLLHCRLAIVDTDPRADQPFRDPDTGVTVALNGEIYNYRQLRQQFADYPFRTSSDTEVIVAAYVKHGIEGFKLLQGMFAFALVDEKRRRVLLVRDAMGKKPLFVLRAADRVLFGSSVLPLLACSGIEAKIETEAAHFYWARAFVPAGSSAIKGAHPVLPGVVLELDWQGQELSTARCEAEPALLYAGENAEEVRGNIGDLLGASVERRLENNPDPVVLLSGGIDSTIVTEVMHECMKRDGRSSPVKVLTLGALIPNTQDEYYARYAARRLGVRLQIIKPGRKRLSDSIFESLSVQDEPLGMPAYFLLHQMVAAAAQHGRVLLTGDGGDEVFLGYRSIADWRHQLSDAPEPSFIKVGPGPSDWMGSWARDVTGNTLLGHMLAKVDRASAEQGVEIRCPLLDWSLSCYVRSLPYDMLAKGGTLKFLLKDQLAGWPEWFLERPKLGFAFNLRWRWALSRFDGLREAVSDETIGMFGDLVPRELRRPARLWTTRAIIARFSEAWRLLVWSTFLNRLGNASLHAPAVPNSPHGASEFSNQARPPQFS